MAGGAWVLWFLGERISRTSSESRVVAGVGRTHARIATRVVAVMDGCSQLCWSEPSDHVRVDIVCAWPETHGGIQCCWLAFHAPCHAFPGMLLVTNGRTSSRDLDAHEPKKDIAAALTFLGGQGYHSSESDEDNSMDMGPEGESSDGHEHDHGDEDGDEGDEDDDEDDDQDDDDDEDDDDDGVGIEEVHFEEGHPHHGGEEGDTDDDDEHDDEDGAGVSPTAPFHALCGATWLLGRAMRV